LSYIKGIFIMFYYWQI